MAKFNQQKLIDSLAPDVQAAFLRAIRDIKSDAQLDIFIRAYQAGDVAAALEALSMRSEYFVDLEASMTRAYAEGGAAAMASYRAAGEAQGATVRVRFDGRNPRAEEGLARHSSRLVVEINEGIRDVVRERLATNMTAGVDAQSAARDIVGRQVGRRGRRQGGILGLTQREAAYVNGGMVDGKVIPGARGQLLSGDPAMMEEYLGRKARDRRFDGVVRKAIKAGKPVSAVDAERITERYSDRLLKIRGDRIARTELKGAMAHAADEGLSQLVEKGVVRSDAITQEWDAASDGDTRPDHRAADGQVRQHGQPFSVGGYAMMHPGDSSLGAPVSQIAFCRCVLRTSIDFLSNQNL